ncbi:MAG: phage terminase small subunit P27 [Xanthobacteraceae bacterium]|nr:MAG: phage terminase small subunit P27 [Xanthobacteraceae bacterium]
MRGRKPDQIATDPGALRVVPSPPSWLAKDAKAEWRRIMPELVRRRILTDGDMGAVEAYCTAVARIREAEKMIAAEGLTTGARKHPAVAIQNDAMTTARQLAAELGLTPVSRSRPTMRESAEDELEFLG